MENKINDYLYPSELQREEYDDLVIYTMSNETGTGIIKCYHVFDGIDLTYNDFHMKDGLNENKLPVSDVMEINYCREGRFECEFKNGDCTYLGAGDMSISMLSNETKSTSFPLAHFHGISITINLLRAQKSLEYISDSLGGIPIDIHKIERNMRSKNRCIVIHDQEKIDHIFSELYTAPEEMRKGYFKLKVIELLMFLSFLKESEYHVEHSYFYKNQVKTVKAIRDFMVENMEEHVSLEELSKRFNIGLTSMKTCFKGVYGTSIYAYMVEYRIHTAALYLRESNDSITEIACRIGYKNPSKFADAFKSRMGVLPSEYRKNICLNGALVDFIE